LDPLASLAHVVVEDPLHAWRRVVGRALVANPLAAPLALLFRSVPEMANRRHDSTLKKRHLPQHSSAFRSSLN
jgi:hypothetical protein